MGSPVTLTNSAGAEISGITPIPGSSQLAATSGNAAAAIATATLAAAAGKTTYLTGFDITGSGATAGLPVVVTIANLLTGALTYTYTAAVGVLVANVPLSIRFPVPIPANAVNTAITVTCPSLGAGNTNNVVNAFGFQL